MLSALRLWWLTENLVVLTKSAASCPLSTRPFTRMTTVAVELRGDSVAWLSDAERDRSAAVRRLLDGRRTESERAIPVCLQKLNHKGERRLIIPNTRITHKGGTPPDNPKYQNDSRGVNGSRVGVNSY